MSTKKTKKKYCTNDELMTELRYYHETGIISEKIGAMFLKMVDRLTGNSYFRNYDSYTKDELKSAAILRMISQINKFDIYRTSYQYKLDKPIIDKTGETDPILYKTVALSIKEGDMVIIDDVEYKRVGLSLVSDVGVYDLKNPTPFAYFTQTAWNAFIRECTNHYKQKNIKRKIAIRYFTNMESNPHFSVDSKLYESMKEMIEEDDHYTKKKEQKKKDAEDMAKDTTT